MFKEGKVDQITFVAKLSLNGGAVEYLVRFKQRILNGNVTNTLFGRQGASLYFFFSLRSCEKKSMKGETFVLEIPPFRLLILPHLRRNKALHYD